MRLTCFVAVLALANVPGEGIAQTPRGPAFEIGAVEPYSYQLAMASSGEFVAAWTRVQPGSPPAGAFARIYRANGSPKTPEFRVNARVRDLPELVRIAVLNDGTFWAAFSSQGVIRARRFNLNGQPLTGNMLIARESRLANIGALHDGGFVVFYDGLYRTRGYVTRAFRSDGSASGPEATLGLDDSFPPAFVVGRDASFVAIWKQPASNGEYTLQGQFFDRSGTPVGAILVISEAWRDSTGTAFDAAVAPDGDFIVVWSLDKVPPREAAGFVRRIAPNGVPQGPQERLAFPQAGRAIAPGAGGGFVSVWQSDWSDSSPIRLLAGNFNAADQLEGSPLALAPPRHSGYPIPIVAGNGGVEFVAAWNGRGRGRYVALMARRFTTE